MKAYFKMCGLILVALPNINFAIMPGYYGDVGIGVSAGPASVIAPGNGNTLTAGSTDVYGLESRGAVGAFVDLGYNFTPYFGVEGNYTFWGWQGLSSFTGQVTTATGGMSGGLYSQSVGGNLVGYVPLEQEKINIFAKLGIAGLFSTLNIEDPSNSIFFLPTNYSQSSAEPALTYGAGVQYQCSSHVSIQLAWNGISQLTNTPISNLYYNMASIGVRYTVPNKLPAIFQK